MAMVPMALFHAVSVQTAAAQTSTAAEAPEASEPSADATDALPEQITLYLADFTDNELRLAIEREGSRVLSEFNAAVLGGRAPVLGGGIERLNENVSRLWDTAPMYVPDPSVILTLNELTDGSFEVRGIPLMLRSGEGEVYEEGILFFTQEGTPSDFRIALPLHQYSKLMQQGTDAVDKERRQEIIAFTEELRTAYNRKDIDFIRDVFSDQALIIVGNVVQSTDESSPYEKQVEYLRFGKQEYVERLERVFRNNSFIDVTFEKITILKHNKYPDVYGVNMDQYYKSSTYEDEGYLFLLVDFKDPEQPMIHVRVWQPLQQTPESTLSRWATSCCSDNRLCYGMKRSPGRCALSVPSTRPDPSILPLAPSPSRSWIVKPGKPPPVLPPADRSPAAGALPWTLMG